MMILRCGMLLAAAFTLSNCCMSSTGCMVPSPVANTSAPVAHAAWDGLGTLAEDGLEGDGESAPVKKRTSPRRKADVEVSAQSKTNPNWDDVQTADKAEDARLKQKLIICKNCSASQ